MASAQVVETSVTNNSPSQDSNYPNDLFHSRYVSPRFKRFSCFRNGGIVALPLPCPNERKPFFFPFVKGHCCPYPQTTLQAQRSYFLFISLILFQDHDGNTPLHCAVAGEKQNMVEMLLNNPRLNLTITNHKDFNYLQFAVLKGNKL